MNTGVRGSNSAIKGDYPDKKEVLRPQGTSRLLGRLWEIGRLRLEARGDLLATEHGMGSSVTEWWWVAG